MNSMAEIGAYELFLTAPETPEAPTLKLEHFVVDMDNYFTGGEPNTWWELESSTQLEGGCTPTGEFIQLDSNGEGVILFFPSNGSAQFLRAAFVGF